MRIPPRLTLAIGVAVLVAWTAEERRDDERECTLARTAFYAVAEEEREEGAEKRQELRRRFRTLIEQYEPTAPICGGRLRVHEAYLLTLNEEYEEIIRVITPYVNGAGHKAAGRSRLLLNLQLAYALFQEGRTVESARAYFKAAGLADEAPARFGARAFVEAAAMSRSLGEEQTSEQYLRSALALIDDSLHVDGSLLDTKGFALVSLSMLTDFRLRNAESTAERDSLVATLEQVTSQALDVLAWEGQGAGHRSLATSLHALAAALAGQPDLAQARLAPSFGLARRAGNLVPAALFNAYLAEGRIAELAGDLEGAEAAFDRARDEATRIASWSSEADALEHLGRLAEHQERWDDAATYYRAAVQRRETLRDRLGLEDWSTSAFGTMQVPYRGLVRSLLAQGDAVGAFQVLDQTRARHLRDLRYHHRVRRNLAGEKRRQVDSVSEQLSQVRMAYLQAEETTRRAELRRETSALQGQIEALTSAPIPSLESVDVVGLTQALVRQDRTLVSYFIDGARSTAFVVRSDTLVALPLPVSPGRVRALLREVGAPWRGDDPDPAFALGPLHQLYEALVEPVRPWVETEAVTIVPDMDIATTPFAMLLTAPAEDFQTAPYLLREWTITMELAAALVTEEAAPADGEGLTVLALGRSMFPEGSTWNGARLGELKHAGSEVEGVSDYRQSESYLNVEATEARFDQLAPSARVIHLASHAEANSALPLYSRIALSEGNGEDGTLHLHEILDRSLVADLVVLSGCSTADGGRRDGEGLMGLQYGMRAAGSAASLATLWAVADGATAELMDGFYDGLAAGLGKDEALRLSQLAYLNRHEGLEASPFFWAAPILSGSPSPIQIHDEPRWWLWMGGLALLAGLAWGIRSRRAHA